MSRSSLLRVAVAVSCFCGFLSLGVSADEAYRSWSDKSGKFEVQAKLVRQDDSSAKLLKKDGRVITVPIRVLSEADQEYLKQALSPEVDPFAGGALMGDPADGSAESGSSSRGPAADDGQYEGLELITGNANPTELQAGRKQLQIDLDAPVSAMSADPGTVVTDFHQCAIPLEDLDAYARCSNPFLLDPSGPVFAVSTHRNANASGPANFGRIYLVDATRRGPEVALDISETLMLMDHHVGSGRSVAVMGVESPSDRGGDLVLLAKLASGEPAAVARWRLPEWDKPGFKPKVEFARLIDAERAVVQVNSSVYLWNLKTGETEFSIERIQAGSKIEVSGGGKYLAIPHNGGKGCRIVDLDAGEFLGAISFPSLLTPEVKFSPDGSLLAMVGGSQFMTWDLANATVLHEGTISSPMGKFYGWVGDKYLLAQLGGLVDLDLGMTIWSYGFPSGNQVLPLPGGAAAVDKHKFGTLLCMPAPHGPVAAVAKQLDAGDSKLMLMKPGSSVSLKIDSVSGVDVAEIEQGLRTAVERAGWIVAKRAAVTVTAKIERAEKQTLHFRTLGASFRETESVSMRPYTASIQVTSDGNMVWSRRSTNMVPSLVRLEKGESLKKAVKRYEKPDPGYFSRLTIPPRLLRPEIGKKVGRSRIQNGQWIDF